MLRYSRASCDGWKLGESSKMDIELSVMTRCAYTYRYTYLEKRERTVCLIRCTVGGRVTVGVYIMHLRERDQHDSSVTVNICKHIHTVQILASYTYTLYSTFKKLT
jgi:hypothetical protein